MYPMGWQDGSPEVPHRRVVLLHHQLTPNVTAEPHLDGAPLGVERVLIQVEGTVKGATDMLRLH